MKYYKKINTVYKRLDSNPNILTDIFRDDTVGLLRDIKWIGTEKIDGTNTCIYWDGHNIEIGGHSNKSVFNPKVLKYLEDLFKTNEMEEKIEELFGEREVCIYGETYGDWVNPSIGHGKNIDFIVFDIYFVNDNHYLNVNNMQDVASKLGLNYVKTIITGPLKDMENFVLKERHPSLERAPEGTSLMEGLVCRPAEELFDSNGDRLIVKVKWKDFKGNCKNCINYTNNKCSIFNHEVKDNYSCSRFVKEE